MNLREFFEENKNVAVAFSGGVDSSYLLYAALQYAQRVQAYYVKTAFQPQSEYYDAIRLADGLKAPLKIIETDILSYSEITANPADRCYHCKKLLFGKILGSAAEDGFEIILDGTNASDDVNDRPGMRALRELEVKSPLRECGLTKSEIRELSKEAGLFTWNKPAYACLATRIHTDEVIDARKLEITEKAESFLYSLGFKDVRVRMTGNDAKVQVPVSQLASAEEKREIIISELKKYYGNVLLDPEGRK